MVDELEGSLEFKQFDDINPIEFLQTGHDIVKITTCRSEYTTAPTYGGMTDADLNPRVEAEWGVAGTPSETALDADVNIAEYVMKGLAGQARGWIRKRKSTAAWADLASDEDIDILYIWYLDFIRGLHNQKIRKVQEDGSTAATDMAEEIQGLAWLDEGLGSTNMHYQYTRRWAWLFGIYYAGIKPGFVDKLDAATETNRNRLEMILAALAAVEFCYLFPMMAANSERLAFGLGAEHSGALSSAIRDPESFKSSGLAPIWIALSKEDKQDIVGTDFANYDPMNGDFWRYDFLESASFEVALHRAMETFQVSKFGLSGARLLTGASKAEYSDRTINFANLFTLHMPDHANYPAEDKYGTATTWDHGVSMWCTGLDLAVVLDWLYAMRGTREDCIDLVTGRAHYTWAGPELLALVKNMWVDFNFVKSLSGYCQPVIQRALDRHIRFVDNTKTTANGVTYYPETKYDKDDPEEMGDGTLWYSDDANVELSNHWTWLSLYIMGNQNENMRLLSTGGMTIEEMMADFIVGVLYDANDANIVDKFQFSKIVAVSIVSAYDHNKFYGFASGETGREEPRFEDVYDVLDPTSAEGFVFREALNTCDIGSGWTPRYMEPRPKGLNGMKPTWIPNWGMRETKIKFAQQMMSLFGANSPFEAKSEDDKVPPPPAEKPKEKEKDPIIIPSDPAKPPKPETDQDDS